MNVSRIKLVGMALVIFAATVWLYWPSVHGGFLKVDDVEYLWQSVRWNGLTWKAVKWAFTSTDPYYHPLPRLSHVLDYQIWGKNAVGHHATSVFLHALNAALVFGFLWTLLGATSLTTGERLMVALWVAAVFASHPLQTESVAWMSGRTQLLCTTFGIGSVWAYAAGARRWVVWVLFALAVLSKPMAVSLPFAMLAIDYFPLRRHERLGWGRLAWEKAAMIALAAAAALATMITEPRQVGPTARLAVVPLSVRVFRAFGGLTFYPLKLVWPSHLSPNYVSDLPLGQWTVLASVLVVVVVTAAVVVFRRRMPALAAAWGSYVMLVLPVSGLMPMGSQVVAMRYAYVAMLPVLLLAGGAGVWLWRHSTTAARLALIGLLACELCVFAAGTRRLIPDWHNDETMRRATLVEFPDSEEANRALATELSDQGRASEALKYAQRGVEIAPRVWEAHVILGRVLCQLSRFPEAIGQEEQALQINPDSARANFSLGVALMNMGKVPEAMKHYEQALRIKPDYAGAHLNLGAALEKLGRNADAIRHYEEASRIAPDYTEAHESLGNALVQVGRLPEAIAPYEQVLRINPDDAEAHCNLGVALLAVGRVPEAIGHWEQALRIKPDQDVALDNLAVALLRVGRVQEAMGRCEQALRIKPDDTDAHYNLGLAMARLGRVPEAIAQYGQALRIDPNFVEAHYNLGIALEKAGRVPEAIQHYEQALRIKPDFIQAQNALARLQAGQ
jgi:tetratricopeptide (TPR) repeat protein